MKLFSIISALLLCSSFSFASGKTPPSSDGYGTPRCAAYDDGSTEEHGSHASCDACLQAHPGCDLQCFSYDYTCSSTGMIERYVERVDPATGRVVVDRRLENQTFTIVAPTRDQGIERAIHQCQMSGGMSCSYGSCSENSHLMQTMTCRR